MLKQKIVDMFGKCTCIMIFVQIIKFQQNQNYVPVWDIRARE